jgi:hypothetical protein
MMRLKWCKVAVQRIFSAKRKKGALMPELLLDALNQPSISLKD